MVNGLFFFIGQLLEFISDLLSLPSALIYSLATFFYGASGIYNNGDNGNEDE